MKNLFLSFMLIFSFLIPPKINKVYSEPVNFSEIKIDVMNSNNDEDEGDFVTQHKDITLKIGTLEFPAIFLYKDESVPYQGYLIKFNDFLGIESFVENINKGCDILYDELLKECKKDLDQCQENCDERINTLLKEKDSLEMKLKLQIELTESEKTKRYIWTSLGLVAGASVGILTYSLVK